MKHLLVGTLVMLVMSITSVSAQPWRYIEEGTAFATVDDNIWIFRIDQKSISFGVKGSNLNRKILPDWANRSIGAINLNMFEAGNLPVGYTKIRGKVIQPKIGTYNAFIVWNSDTLMIMDRTVDKMSEIMSYPNVSQNIRMVASSGKRNRWQQDEKIWSVSAIGTTTDGYILFIHSRYPYQMHEFIDVLLSEKNLHLHRLAYLEGGPESGVVVTGAFSTPLKQYSRMGSYETGFNENNNNYLWYGLPWVLTFDFR